LADILDCGYWCLFVKYLEIRVRFRVRFRIRDRVTIRVRVWIVWYMDAQMAARFGSTDPY